MSALTEVAAPGTDLPRRRARGRGDGLGPWWLVAAVLPVAFLLVFFAWPVAAMLWRGIGGDADAFTGAVDLTAFGETLARERTWRILGQTLGMAAAGTVVSVALGLPTAFVLHRRRVPGRAVLRALVLVPFVLPTVVVGVAFRALLAPGGPLGFTGLDQTTTAVVLAMVFFNVSVVVRQVGALWNALDPRQTEAARTLGASPWRAFRTVTLPQLAPAIAASAALVFLFCASAFGIVQTLGRPGYGTLESEIWVQTSVYLDLRTAAVFSVLQFAVVLAAVVVSGVTAARTQRALRLRETPPARLTRADAVPVAVMLAVVALVVAPILTLVVRSFHTRHGWGLGNYRLLSTSAGSGFVGGSTPAQALEQSLRVAVDATLVTLVVAVPLALLLLAAYRIRMRRYRSANERLSRLVDERTSALQQRTEQLLRADSEKSELLSRLRSQAEAFERQAYEDALTGLPNRRSFDEALQREFARARRKRQPLCVLTLDVDHFKAINDAHTHAGGDAVLREMGALLVDTLRASDMAARIGGEEFAVLLVDGTLDDAAALHARLRARLAARSDWGGLSGLRVTVSAGASMLEPRDASPADVYRRADEALYRAKSAGRDRIHMA